MAAPELSILIIDENRLRSAIIEAGLREAGHERVTVLNSTNEVARRISRDRARCGGDRSRKSRSRPARTFLHALEGAAAAGGDVRRPSDAAAIEAAIEAGVSAYVVDGLRKERVKSILDMAMLRFNAYSRLQRELDEARTALEDRKLIDRAKAILMRSAGSARPMPIACCARPR